MRRWFPVEITEGAHVEVESETVGRPPRRGSVRRVLKEDPLRIEVEWEDGHTSIFEPQAGSLHVTQDA